MGLEVSTLGFFALLARQNVKAEALLKIFVIQRLAALLFLWAGLMFYTAGLDNGSVVLGAALLKMGIFPFVH